MTYLGLAKRFAKDLSMTKKDMQHPFNVRHIYLYKAFNKDMQRTCPWLEKGPLIHVQRI